MSAIEKNKTTVDGGACGAPPPNHHLPDEVLLDYASGAADEGVSLLVATHLTLCPICRDRAAELDALGGELVENLPPADLSDDAFAKLLARLDEPGSEPAAAEPAREEQATDDATLPRVLQRYVGAAAQDIPWQPLGLGVDHVDLSVEGGSRAMLLRVPEGRAVPQHTHEGNEYVLVLQGGFSDAHGHFVRGDVEASDDSVDHRPVADVGEDCICLAVTDAPLKLTSLVGRALNRFAKL